MSQTRGGQKSMSSHSYDDVSRANVGSPLAAAKTLRAVALAAGLALMGVSGAVAQDGTPEAMAGSGECVAAEGAMAPAETMGTPAASPEAEADTAGEGTAADDALAADVTAAIENYIACYNAGEFGALLTLATPAYNLDLFGTDDAAAIESGLGMAELPSFEVLALGEVMTYEDGRVSIDGEYLSGEHQYSKTRTYFTQAGDALLIDDEEYLPATPDVEEVAVISFSIADDTAPLVFDGASTVPAIEGLVLYGANNGAERHSIALLRLPDEAAGTPVAEVPMEQMMASELIGAINIDAGEREELVLLNLPPGTYLLLDALVPGSAAVLTVTEPAPDS